MQPQFSIVVPIYNIETYLSECLSSISNQDFDDYEVILVDDGSTDNSHFICDEYVNKYKNAKVIHKKNGGLVSARIAGAKISKGKYIVCIDGDDWVDSSYLNVFNSIVIKSSPDIICCGYIEETPNKKIDRPVTNENTLYNRDDIENNIHPYVIESIDGRSFPKSVWAKAFKRELYLQHQLNVPEKLKIGEDAACVKPCVYNANSIYMTTKCLYHYRYNPSSLTKKRKPFDWTGPQMIADAYRKGINQSNDIINQIYRETVHNIFNICKSCFYQEKKYKDIKSEILKEINKDFYHECIMNATYKNSFKHKFALYSLKYHLIGCIAAYSKISR